MLPTPELEIARNLPPLGCGVEQAQRYTRWLAPAGSGPSRRPVARVVG